MRGPPSGGRVSFYTGVDVHVEGDGQKTVEQHADVGLINGVDHLDKEGVVLAIGEHEALGHRCHPLRRQKHVCRRH